MLTKFVVDETLLSSVLEPLGSVDSLEPLTGGMFATAYRVTFTDGRRAVAKIVGADATRLFTYERGLLATEALTYRMLASTGVPVPEVLHTDFTRSILDADIVVADHLPGTPWLSLELDETATATVRRNLGAVMACIAQEPAPAFGYPAAQAGLAADTWSAAFRLMVEAVLADAERWQVELPAARARAVLATHSGALGAVTHPRIVHTDLWEGNIFVDPETLEIVGVIDTERTVWGDPILEVVGTDQFATGAPDADVLFGDAEARGDLARELSSPTGEIRLRLYRLYFSLILASEPTIRGYEGDWTAGHEATARANIEHALQILEATAPAR
ncbi:phosphotransferase family protein [Microbacterium sp. SS28]|uniref:phosphotransferase family protein n=1 Tax=Microbacterium sp. SS28 TaxID=2919948 RepID=UPI001FAB067A|nr:aminoglycoside phosphotransferase family protein [Microbacterium sp. SS28]